MSIWVYSETSRLAGGMSTLLNELRPSVDTVKNAMAELQGNIGDGSALSGQAYSKISDTITNYLSPIADGFDKLESNVSSSLSIYRRSGAVLAQEVKKIDSAKLEQAIQTEIMIQRAGEALMATTLAGAIPMVRDYVESHADKVKELRKHLEAYSTYKSSVSHLFDDDLVALNALTTALNDISSSTLNPDGSISFPGNKVPSWPKTLSAYSASAGQSYKQQLQSTFALDGQTAADVDALQKGLKKKFPDKSNEELAYMTMLLISKAQYAGPLWKQTSGDLNDYFNSQDVAGILKKYGVKDPDKFIKAIQNQHNNAAKYGLPDFVHFAATLATNLNKDPISVVPAVGTAVGGATRSDLSGWLGDVSPIIANPSMGDDDYKADLDAVNIAERVKSSGASLASTMHNYYSEIKSGDTNRATEFTEHIPVSEVIEKVNKIEGHGKVDNMGPKVSVQDFGSEKTLNNVAKQFVDSLKHKSNTLELVNFGF